MKSWVQIAVMAAVVFLLFVLYGNPSCGEVSNFSFTITANQTTLADGESTTLHFRFYPIPGRTMTFHNDTEEKIWLYSSEEIYDKQPFLVLKRTSAKTKTFIDENKPLEFSVAVRRSKLADGLIILDIGKFGYIASEAGASIYLGAGLHPAYECYLDSADGFNSEEIELIMS